MNILKQAEEMFDQVMNNEQFTRTSLLAAVTVIGSTYVFFKWFKMLRFFKRLNIPSPTPLPVIGNFIGFMSKGITKFDDELFENCKSDIVGYFEGPQPVVICKDVDMIKHCMVKDFSHFANRRKFELSVDMFESFLTLLEDEEWKNVRAIVTTTFTSGKLKHMLDTMLPCMDDFIEHMDGIAESGDSFDVKENFQKLTFDVICSSCFGMQTNSIKNPDDPFAKAIKEMFVEDIKIVLPFILFPNLMKKLAAWKLYQIVPFKTVDFFQEFIEDTIKRRKNKELFRNDFIQMMIDHEENSKNVSHSHEEKQKPDGQWKPLKKSLTNMEILSQAFLFLIAGSDTTALTMTYVTYLLAKNPEIQAKLYNEIENAFNEHNEVNYEMVNKIEYLEMVIDEALRMFPPAIRTDRRCNQDYRYKDMIIPKGTVWGACIWALHHDPKIYPDPEKFDPERFSTEGKKLRDNCAFLPFGAGPRNCIGLRFALLEIKIMLCKLMMKYEFVVCNETPDKIIIDNSGFSRSTVPIKLKLNKRS